MKILKYIGIALFGIVLCMNFAACSDDEDYETVVKTIHVETAGTLSSLISAEAIEQITDLTLSGYINGTDVKIIKKMPLRRADFTDLHIVGGGDNYGDYYYPNYTEDNIFPTSFGGYWLSEIKLPNSVTEIGKSAFANCLNLNSVEIPNSVTKIGEYSFSTCECLKYIKIPDSVTEIGYSAFNGCTSLVSIEIPNSVTVIGSDAFRYCTDLTSVKILNSVTELGYGAFANCTSLASIKIPDSVTALDGTFLGCTSLVSVEIPNSVTALNGTFESCTSLASIKIPDSVTALDGTFWGCTGLTSVEIPNSVTEIGSGTFANAGLKEIHMKNPTPPDVEDNAFSTYAYVTLYVPVGSKDAYMQHEIWGKFGNIVEE